MPTDRQRKDKTNIEGEDGMTRPTRSNSRSPEGDTRRSRSPTRKRRRDDSRSRSRSIPKERRRKHHSHPRSRSRSRERRRRQHSDSRSRSRSRERKLKHHSDSRSRSRDREKRRRARSISSSSDSSEGTSHRRKEHRKDKDNDGKRSKSKERRKKRREKKEKKEKKKKDKGNTLHWGKYGIISDVDIFTKSQEFHTWLVEERKINPETVSKEQQKKEFSRFVEDYNTATLSHEKYYNMEAYERRMSALRQGEYLPPANDSYDFEADMKAVTGAHKKKATEQETYMTKEQLMQLRKVQQERNEVGRMKLLGMDVKQNFGVRMDGTMFDG